jgi:hypothetical protein
MLLLASTSDKIRLVTSAAASINVHASYVDLNGSTVTPGRLNTSISTATTTDVVASPGSGTYRTVKTLTVRNIDASNSSVVTVIHTDGTNAMEVYEATLGPGGHLHYNEDVGFFTQSSISLGGDPWASSVIACARDGNPNYVLNQMQLAGTVAPTPTVNRVRWYGVGAVTGVYTMAIYRLSDLARISEQFTLTTTANAWNSAAPASSFTLTAGVPYFVAVGANATGTTAGIGALGGTVAATTGQIQTAPGALPGNLDADVGDISSYRFQFAVTTGAMPATAATLAAQAAWTGGMPAFFLDNNSAA